MPSTRGEYVLSSGGAGGCPDPHGPALIRDRLEPSRDAAGRARPWDVEFGFADGRLWLFQTRPFIGNEQLRNVPALAAYEPSQRRRAAEPLSPGA